jgi:uncharacterized protein (DUF305 family)/Spy/CpxP family protein refolding chaperone
MQWLGKLTLIGLVVLTVGGCAGVMSGGHMGDMDHSAMSTPMAGMDHSGMMTHTETMTGTQMGHMDHSMMQVDPSQPFDAQFIDSMLEHHRGAVTMAEQALAEAEHEELRTLAEGIIAAQTQEIEQMTAWRTSWYPDLPPTAGMDMSMGQMTISEDDSKPFDQRFIEAMISHHQGAIDMAKMAQQMAEHEEIKTLADAIIVAQQAEIEQMQSWLKEWYGVSAAASPYVAQLDSPVRGLSAQEVDDLRAGRGMGFARMAELNNYPGPRHVLDLQEELKLSAEQQASIEAIFSAMQTEAQALGEQILTQEEQLSAAFVSGVVDETTLQQQVMTLAELYGQLRMTHLRAHLQVTPLLTPEQITTYNQLRGYTGNGGHEHMHNMQH